MNPATARSLPIAIVGIGCRLPGGVTDPVSFWQLLTEGRQAVGEVPPDRWSLDTYFHPDRAAAGTMASRWGGFIDTLDRFDASFWGISPREATRMDPQQRWLLEVAWEALEDAGIAPSRMRGSATGVFVGISGNDYGGLQLSDADGVDAYTNSGNTASIAANRISYLLDLRGPSLSVDTACSSSLVAVALACDSLRAGLCEAALAGGVNALLSPHVSVGFSKASMLSATGRCHAFDARADGYVRAEGAGLVLLKPLTRALDDGDRIYAVIRGTAVNQDGHTSSMTVPSVDGQAAMLRAAYAQAGIAPSRVVYVEAHGTGTPVGDPIEANALGTVLGPGRADGEACVIGSVKTNIGHLESASGIAGLIKGALVASHGRIPPSLNYERPNPEIPFERLRLTVATTAQPLISRDGEPAIVGVNSFGFGGTNAHVVLEAPPPATTPVEPERAARPLALPVSARDERALRAYAAAYRDRLRRGTDAARDLCAAAGAQKEHHPHRLVVVGHSPVELVDRMRLWLRDGQAAGTSSGRAASVRAPVFVFTGQGAQWWAMGRQLMAREPLVQRRLAEIDSLLAPLAGWSLADELRKDEIDSRIDDTDVAQPALFALQVALADLWRSWGVQPAAVIGHSVGEVAAAYCAGVYSLDDAVRIIFHRSRLQHTTRGQGRMLAAALSRERAAAVIADADGVELAAVNSPQLVTLTGAARSLEDIERRLVRDGVFARWVRIAYAFHSAQMDPLRDQLLDTLAALRPRATTVPFISTVSGAERGGETLDARYWWDNVREPVRFADGISTLAAAGYDTFVEVGPHPALGPAVTDCVAAAAVNGLVLHSLRRDADDSDELLGALAALYVHGANVDWASVNQTRGARVALPTYPWTRETFWHESGQSAARRLGSPDHPLLGRRVDGPTPTWQGAIDLKRLTYLADHRLWKGAVFPGAGYVEMGLAAAARLYPGDPHAVEGLSIKAPLFLDDESPAVVRLALNPDDKTFAVHSVTVGGAWDLHATGALVRSAIRRQETAPEIAGVVEQAVQRLRRTGSAFTRDRYRAEWSRLGYQFGPNFQLIDRLWQCDGETLTRVVVPKSLSDESAAYVIHPAVLDACFHGFVGLWAGQDEDAGKSLYLPDSIGRILIHRSPSSATLEVWTRLVAHDGTEPLADITVRDADGQLVAEIRHFQLARVEQPRDDDSANHCYLFEWQTRHLRGSGADEPRRFPTPRDLAAAASAAATAHAGELDEYRQRAWPRQLVGQLVLNAFAELGWLPALGERFGFESLVTRLGIVPEHHRATISLLRDLEVAGWLEPDGPRAWRVTKATAVVDGRRAVDAIEQRAPHAAPDLDLLRLTGSDLAKVLSGEIDAVSLLFPGGSTDTVARFHRDGGGAHADFEAFRRSLAGAVADLPPRRTLRVLEVGAGTGALTRIALDALEARRIEYWFTDIGPVFLAAARTTFTGAAAIEYRVFDLEKPPEAQGIPEGYFDLVIGSDVLHATADLQATLTHIRRCLAPGGLLMVKEIVTPRYALINATFGLLKGWWRVTDVALRPESPLLDRPQWVRLLGDCGFVDARSIIAGSDLDTPERATLLALAPPADAASIRPTASIAPATYVIVADRGGIGAAVAARLRRLGHQCEIVGDGHGASIADALGVEPDRRAMAGVIHCRSLDNPEADALDIDSLRAAQQQSLMSALALVQAAASVDTPVWFLTRDLFRVTSHDRVQGLAAAPIVGLARVANNEHQCRFFVVDLETDDPDACAAHVLDELTLPGDNEFEVAYRGGLRHAPRLRRQRPEALTPRRFPALGADGGVAPFRLESRRPGVLTNLAWHETSRSAPEAGQVEVKVYAGGLNFRDVLKALGTYPGHPPDRQWFGDDVAGIVERVGEGVNGVRPGDRVAGMAPYAFRAFARTDARFVWRVPPSMTFAGAATVPTAFLTAHYAFHELARLQPGERVLIHAGAGGVGLAAIQIAQHLSLEIFATAGTPEKRALLRSLGVPHVMDSRTLAFADEVHAITNGRGVDAVLNSLAGEFVPRSLATLAPFGRFLEIGKVDIYRNARIGLEALRQNISYLVIDLTQHLRHKPDFVARMFDEIAARFAAGDYRALPHAEFALDEVVAAFRHMAQGKHVGKNVLTFSPARVEVGFNTEPSQRFRPDATYLVVGGAGGMGLRIAEWVAKSGGRHLVLMSRSGPGAESQPIISRLRDNGISVVDARGDAADGGDVARIIGAIESSGHPLKGVFHAAMVLDDDLIAKLTPARFNKVLEPKIAGAWNLHAATRALALEHFVCLSSFSAVLGMPKQANYAAGNVFLDQLAHYRHALGLPAVSVNFGALRGAGFVERELNEGEVLARLGFDAFDVDETMRVLESLMFADAANVAAARVDWSKIQRLSPLAVTAAAYAPVLASNLDGAAQGSLIERLRAASADERGRLVQDFIAAQVAAVFGRSDDRIERDRPLTELGLDSLMVLELTNRIERQLDLRIPMAALLSGPTLVALSATVVRLLADTLDAGPAANPSPATTAAESVPPAAAGGGEPGSASVSPADHVIAVRAGAGRRAFFAFHPLGGGVGIYAGLARRLPDDTWYGVESRLKRGADREYASLEEMAEQYAVAVRRTSDGPYRLIGFSLGGYLAARVAEILEHSGGDVDAVAAIDWDARPQTAGSNRERLLRMLVAAYQFAQADAGLLKPLPATTLNDEIAAVVDAILASTDATSGRFFEWVARRELAASPSMAELARHSAICFEQHCRLLHRELRTPRFTAPLGIWRARSGFGSPLASWQHSGTMNCEHIYEGDHNGWTQPETLDEMAQQLKDFFARAAMARDPVGPGARP